MSGGDPRDDFVARFGHLFEHSPWVVARAHDRGPFADAAALHGALMAVVGRASAEEQLALIRAHPELAAKVALTPDSAAEQAGAGLRHLSEAASARLQALNAAYREKFGMPFIICVRRHDQAAIFAAFEARLANDAAAEHAAALREIGDITWLRLRDLNVEQVAA